MSEAPFILRIEPLDTLHFSDGRPFSQDDAGLTETESLFPPPPSSVAGAVRAMLARNCGWDGRSRWKKDDEYGKMLGDGPWNTGALRLGAVTLRKGGTVYYPAPLALLSDSEKENKEKKKARLAHPRIGGFETDIRATVQVLTFDETELERKAVSGLWISQTDFEAVLAGTRRRSVITLYKSTAFISREHRVGIALEDDRNQKRAADGMLYTASHVRLKPEVNLLVEAHWDGDAICKLPTDLGTHPFGGRGRVASFSRTDNKGLRLCAFADENHFAKEGGCLVAALSPCLLGTNMLPFGGICTVVCGAHDRATRFALWQGGKGHRSAWRWMLPAGSCWWLEYDEVQGRKLWQRLKKQGANDGDRASAAFALGFGAVAIGKWEVQG